MNARKQTTTSAQIGTMIRDIVDEEWIEEGATQDELNENRQLSERFAELLSAGYTEKQINAEWQGKTPQEILNAETNGHAPNITLDRFSLAQLERIASFLHFEDDIPKDASRTGLITLIQNGVRRTGKSQQLAEAIKELKVVRQISS